MNTNDQTVHFYLSNRSLEKTSAQSHSKALMYHPPLDLSGFWGQISSPAITLSLIAVIIESALLKQCDRIARDFFCVCVNVCEHVMSICFI